MKVKNKVAIPLNAAAKQHYKAKILDQNQLAELTSLINLSDVSASQEESENQAANNSSIDKVERSWLSKKVISEWLFGWMQWRFRAQFTSLLAGLVAFAGSWVLYLEYGVSNTESIMRQIAYNHQKQMVVQTASQLTEVAELLPDLSFDLLQSERLPGSVWGLLGGRYCKINNVLAAQLKLRNKNDQQVYTLYQVLLPEKTELPLEPQDGYIDGVKVQIWKESGLLFGLAVN